MKITTKAARDAAMSNAHAVASRAKAADRDLTLTECNEIEETVEAVKGYDATRRAMYGDLLGDPGVTNYKSGQAVSHSAPDGAELPTDRLAFTGPAAKASAHLIAQGMTDGAKALVPAGTLTTAVPIAETVITGRPLGSLMAALPVVRRSTPTWRYLRQGTRTNNAAIVAPGAIKPTTVLGLTNIDGAFSVFAHMSEPVDKFTLGDNESLSRFVADELLYTLGAAVEAQVVSGSGLAGNLTGLLNTSGIQTQAYITGKVETLRAAITALEVAGYEASAIALAPADWQAIETARATSGSFDLGGPIDRAARRVWGVPVVTGNAIPAGTGLVFDSTALAVVKDTAGIEVRWSDSNADDFAKNQLRARVEGRFGIDVFQPAAIVKATLTGV